MYLTGVLVVTLFTIATGNITGPQPAQVVGKALTAQDAQAMQESAQESPFSAQATPPPPTQDPQGSNPDGDKVVHMSRFCFFGKFPSATCRFRCHLMDKEAFCVGVESEHVQNGVDRCECKAKQAPPPEENAQDLFAKPETHKEQEVEKEKKPEEEEYTIPLHTVPQGSEEEQPKHHMVLYVLDLNKIFGPPPNGSKEGTSEGEAPEPQTGPAGTGWPFQHLLALFIILLLFFLIALELYACYKKQRAKNNDMDSIFKNIPMPNKA